MIAVAALAVTLFFDLAWLGFLDLVPAVLWFSFKVFIFLYVFIWIRGTLPRFRFDLAIENLSPRRPGQCHGVGRSDLVVDVNTIVSLASSHPACKWLETKRKGHIFELRVCQSLLLE